MFKSRPSVVNSNFSVVLSHREPARVILSVPHDGLLARDFSALFRMRRSGVTKADVRVWPIANGIVTNSMDQEMPIDAVRFLIPRAFVDANRPMLLNKKQPPQIPQDTALEDSGLEDAYTHYHTQLRGLIERSITKYGKENVLLIDLHGFGPKSPFPCAEHYDLILGTANRGTIQFGEVDRAFARFMEERGYRTFLPSENSVVPLGDPFSAGYTTRSYANQYNVNAMQIEIFTTYRSRDDVTPAIKLSADMAAFLLNHYKAPNT